MKPSRIVRSLAGALALALAALPADAAMAATPAKVTVRFDANGGTGSMRKQVFRRGVAQKLRANAFKRTGGVFVGWAKSRNGAVAYSNRQKVKNLKASKKTLTLYARWAKSTYKVRFMPNGGTGKMSRESFRYGKAKKLSKNRFKRTGYVFRGWSNRPNGKVLFRNGQQVKNLTKTGQTVRLYAIWTWANSNVRYMIVDLSGGPTAKSYPVTYRTKPPSGGFNTDKYKTTKLVLRRLAPGPIPKRDATITKPFFVGLFEVTQRQWELVMGTRPSYFSNPSYYSTRPVEQVSYYMIRGSSAGRRWPASNAVDAGSFLGKLRARTGLGFDLPTEAQWEYACRAGTTTDYNSGRNNRKKFERDSAMEEVGRYFYNGGSGYLDGEHQVRPGVYSSSCSTAKGSAAVGSFRPNAWGLYDMHGNVWEWCLDRWGGSLSGNDPVGPSSGAERVIRGGGWNDVAYYCTSSYREEYEPPSLAFKGNGFRLASALPK